MATKRIISRAEGGLVPEPPSTRSKVVRPTAWILTHYTGGSGPTTTDGKSDRQHMAELAASAANMGKTWEYNYVITAPLGEIWEMAGEYRAAHCENFNEESIGIQMNLGVGAAPNQAMIDSHRWLREELKRRGQWTGAENVPHYRFRATACCGNMMAEPPGASWPSPTGEGSLGNLLPFMVAPFSEPGSEGMEVSAIIKSTSGAYWYSTGTLKKRLEVGREVDLMRLLIGRSGGNSANYEGVTDAEVAAYFGVDIDVLNTKVVAIEAAANAIKTSAAAALAASQAAKAAAEAAAAAANGNAQGIQDARNAALAAAVKAEEARVAAVAAKEAAEAIPGGGEFPAEINFTASGILTPTPVQ